jgi:2-polyprenyl-3-methyl-5-hydroxy-6-metoxy-1,4-benzoquinol methylase
MTYDWRGETQVEALAPEWFDDQDRRSVATHRHFATDRTAFDRLIPYASLAGQEVLEIGVGSGFHAELMARAGAVVTGIDLTEAAVERTMCRFDLKGLSGHFEQWDAEQPRPDFEGRFAFVWSWGVIHHSSRTARIVRNIERWLATNGRFSGMVYHRNSTSASVALVLDGILRGKLLSSSVDEILWRRADGFSARFYAADQWRDLLLGFFEEASVAVTGTDVDVLPLPRRLRSRLVPYVSANLQNRVLARFGSFVIFDARKPLTPT